MKKLFLGLFVILLSACSNSANQINVYIRDSSSGTREAFEKVIELDDISLDSIEVSSNGDMIVKITNDINGIGYASYSEKLKDSVNTLSFNGIEPTFENIINQSYTLQRSFNYVTRAENDYKDEKTKLLIEAFIDFITNSIEGKQVIKAAGGIVDTSVGIPWETLKQNHPIVLEDNRDTTIITAGSTSVEKTLTAALEAFKPMAGNFEFVINQTGSSDGYKRVLGSEKDGINASDIGFASREFKETEDISKAKLSGTYCLDAVIVIVNKKNTQISNLSKEDLNKIFKGIITDFKEVEG